MESECSHDNLIRQNKEMYKERCPDCGEIVLVINLSELTLEEIPEKEVEQNRRKSYKYLIK